MPLIILSGYPCSGLSYRARQLASLLEDIQSSLPEGSKFRYKIHVVGSHDDAHPRTVYDNARSEKEARAVVYGRVKRLLRRDSIVIVDGMNYIKGWRYQLWCESKSAATPCCVVHVGTPVEQCTANNEARLRRRKAETEPKGEEPESATQHSTPNGSENADDEEPYPPELLSNLIFRYEEPSTAGRWDRPLFTVPWFDPTPPTDDIWSAITGTPRQSGPNALSSNLLGQTSPTTPPDTASTAAPPSSVSPSASASAAPSAPGTFKRSSRPKIVPHQATVQPTSNSPNTLYALEKRTSEIISAIRSFTLSHPTTTTSSSSLSSDPTTTDDDDDNDHSGLTIPIPHTQTPVFIPAPVLVAAPTEELAGAGGVLTLPRLQRLKRQWVALNRSVATGQGHGNTGPMSPEQAGEAFVRFLNAEFEGVEVGSEI